MTRAVTSSERVAATLREMIRSGDLSPGLRLGETGLAERLGVSRTPVREALTRLAAEGLVEISPNRGASVVRWSVAELESVFDLRAALEPRLTALAVARLSGDDLDELSTLADRMCGCDTSGDLDALVPLNRDFHGLLVARADAPALAAALASVVHAPLQRRNFHSYDDAALHRSLAHHREIAAAARAGDGEWAGAVMTAHIRNARAVMLAAAGTDR